MWRIIEVAALLSMCILWSTIKNQFLSLILSLFDYINGFLKGEWEGRKNYAYKGHQDLCTRISSDRAFGLIDSHKSIISSPWKNTLDPSPRSEPYCVHIKERADGIWDGKGAACTGGGGRGVCVFPPAASSSASSIVFTLPSYPRVLLTCLTSALYSPTTDTYSQHITP